MAENKFDKENILVPAEEELPFMVEVGEKVYDIKDNRKVWWQCPKCGSDITFYFNEVDSNENFSEEQLTTMYPWWCDTCAAQGAIFAVVNPLYISLEPNDEEG